MSNNKPELNVIKEWKKIDDAAQKAWNEYQDRFGWLIKPDVYESAEGFVDYRVDFMKRFYDTHSHDIKKWS